METATIREVQHNLAAYVRRVELGEEVEIRRRNKVVARMVPAEAAPTGRDLKWEEVEERCRRPMARRNGGIGDGPSSAVDRCLAEGDSVLIGRLEVWHNGTLLAAWESLPAESREELSIAPDWYLKKE